MKHSHTDAYGNGYGLWTIIADHVQHVHIDVDSNGEFIPTSYDLVPQIDFDQVKVIFIRHMENMGTLQEMTVDDIIVDADSLPPRAHNYAALKLREIITTNYQEVISTTKTPETQKGNRTLHFRLRMLLDAEESRLAHNKDGYKYRCESVQEVEPIKKGLLSRKVCGQTFETLNMLDLHLGESTHIRPHST